MQIHRGSGSSPRRRGPRGRRRLGGRRPGRQTAPVVASRAHAGPAGDVAVAVARVRLLLVALALLRVRLVLELALRRLVPVRGGRRGSLLGLRRRTRWRGSAGSAWAAAAGGTLRRRSLRSPTQHSAVSTRQRQAGAESGNREQFKSTRPVRDEGEAAASRRECAGVSVSSMSSVSRGLRPSSAGGEGTRAKQPSAHELTNRG
jgi:hypothetical protein